ncbi:MAG: hypothetical protein M3141_07910 [Actinomycetota bacterium]|nr:hypothetical protein [Actinomycetota bacterium]
MRKILIAGVLAALAVPAAASAGTTPDPKSPAQQCRAERTAMGETEFKNLYGTNRNKSNAFGKCVSKQARSQDANTDNAAKRCRAERSQDAAAFREKYGTNRNKSNAFGKCVSQHARAATAQQQQDRLNAARTCRAEQRQDAAAFRQKYGTNRNKSNAFGKCVSQHARAQS